VPLALVDVAPHRFKGRDPEPRRKWRGWQVGYPAGTMVLDKGSEYLKRHLVPSDRDLWKMDRFEDFIAERKKLIGERFKTLLITAQANPEAAAG